MDLKSHDNSRDNSCPGRVGGFATEGDQQTNPDCDAYFWGYLMGTSFLARPVVIGQGAMALTEGGSI